MGRRASREASMKLLYKLAVCKEYRVDCVDSHLEELEGKNIDRKYIEESVKGAILNTGKIDIIIESKLVKWKLDRISKVDLSILRLAIYEIMYMDEIPVSVSINEAVELAKKFSSYESASFINGLLGKILPKGNQESST